MTEAKKSYEKLSVEPDVLGKEENKRQVVDVKPIEAESDSQGSEATNEVVRSERVGSGGVKRLNDLAHLTRDETKSLIKDPKTPNAMRIAALAMWRATSKRTTSGGIPIAAAAFDQILDRTIGKPVTHQHVAMESTKRTEHVLHLTEDSIKRLESFASQHRKPSQPSNED